MGCHPHIPIQMMSVAAILTFSEIYQIYKVWVLNENKN